jgi:F-type H+-transporting ATPase subunit a
MMRLARLIGTTAVLLSGLAGAPLPAQEHGARYPTQEVARELVAPESQHQANQAEIDIVHHIGNAHEVEIPFVGAVELPKFPPVHIGNLVIDLSPTKHLVFMVLAALLVTLVFTLTARSVARAQAEGRPAKGFAGAMEATALYIRQEVILPNVGHHGEGFVPYLLTLFFFILAMNLLGLVPWGSTATGNIAVTAALALMAFITIEIAGMRSLGLKGYLHTIFYLPPGLPTALKPIMLIIMTPVEIIGKLSKPFALAVRLFANMTAGHVLVLALIGLTFLFQSYVVGIGASVLATAIMLLELFVAFLQAFVFTLLTSVFIGLIRAEH